MSVEIMPRADAEWHLLLENQKAESNTLREQVATLTAERDEAREELGSVLSDWNALVKASGSLTHGSAVGVVARLRADVERLTKSYEKLNDGFRSALHDLELANARNARHLAAIETLRRGLWMYRSAVLKSLVPVDHTEANDALAATADYAKKADEVADV